jgi:hypothetical protein
VDNKDNYCSLATDTFDSLKNFYHPLAINRIGDIIARSECP